MTDNEKPEKGLDTLKADFSPHAVIDPNTGMYTMPEPLQNEKGFTATEVGGEKFFLPVPTMKSIRLLRLETQQIEVEETLDECKTMVSQAKVGGSSLFYTFTDPTFGTQVAITATALADCVAILDGWKDLDETADNMRAAEYAKTMKKQQLANASLEIAKAQQYKRGRGN